MSEEPQLCDDCPRAKYLWMVKQKSWSNAPAENSTVKLCAKLRALEIPGAPKCQHYPKTEDITLYFGRPAKKRKKKT